MSIYVNRQSEWHLGTKYLRLSGKGGLPLPQPQDSLYSQANHLRTYPPSAHRKNHRPASRVSSGDGAGPVPAGDRCWGGFLVQGFSLGGGGSFSSGPVAASSSKASSAGGSLGSGGRGSPPKGPPGPRALCARCSARGLTGTAAWGTLCPSTRAGDGSPRAPAMMAVAALSSLAASLPSRSGGDSCSACRLAVTNSDSFSAATAGSSPREWAAGTAARADIVPLPQPPQPGGRGPGARESDCPSLRRGTDWLRPGAENPKARPPLQPASADAVQRPACRPSPRGTER